MAKKMITKKDKKAFLKRLNDAKKKVENVRDELREIHNDIIDFIDSAERGAQDLENAIDALSELV